MDPHPPPSEAADLLALLPHPILVVSAEVEVIEANQAARTLLGHAGFEPLGHTLDRLPFRVEDEDGSPLEPAAWPWMRALATHQPEGGILGLELPDAERLWLEVQANPTRQGTVVVALTDLTRLRTLEGELRQSDARFRLLFDVVPGIAVQGYDADGTVRYWNQASERIYGYSPEEALGGNLMDLIIPPPMREAVAQDVSAAVREGREIPSGELRLMGKGGRPVEVYSTHVVVSSPGHPKELFCLDLDLAALGMAREAMVASEARFRGLFESMQEGFALHEILLDPEGRPFDYRFLEVNRAFEAMTGIPRERWIGRTVREVYPGVEPQWIHVYGEVALTGIPATLTAEASGLGRTYRVTAYAPRPDQFAVLTTDITGQRRMEAELQQAYAHLKGVLEALPDLLFILDGEGRFETVHAPEGMPLLVSAAQIIGATMEAVLPQELARKALDCLARLRAGSPMEVLEYHLDLPQNPRKFYEARFRPFQNGGAVILVRDITAQVQAEDGLRASELRLHVVTTHAPDTIVQITPEGRILYINRTVAGLSMDEVVGQDWMQWMPEGEPQRTARRALDQAVATAAQVEYRVQGAGPHGSLRWYQVRLSPVLEEDRVQSLIVFSTDITEHLEAEEARAALERQIQRAQKMESLGSLAGGVAHDMNNVLGAILGLASACRAQEPEGTRLARSLDTIATACERGGTLVRGLLNFSREGLAEEKALDLNALIREEVQLLERTTLQRVQLVMDLEPDLRAVRGDGGALSHALMNLCVNAVDAMETGGTLTLRTRNGAGDQVVLSVVDTGSGMPPEVLEKALDPFFTTKPVGKGTGLGLSIVYGTVKAHRGNLSIQSRVGKGTNVELTFPGLPGPSEALPTAAQPADSSPLRVLLVDDDELVQKSLDMLLEALGCTRQIASSGEEALQVLQAGARFDAVILDMNMPGLGGEGTLPRLRALCPDVPVLLATGRADQSVLNLVANHSGVTILPKPFGLSTLREHLERLQG